MATIVGDIAIQVGADIAPLITNLGKAQGSVVTFGRSAEAAASGPMARMASAAGVIAGAATAASIGLIALTKSAIDNIGALNDAAKAVGLHVAQLQAMQQVAEEASVGSDSLTKALVKMQDTLANAAKGGAAQVDALHALGLSVADITAQSPDEQFARLAEAIDGITDPTARAEAAINIFGRSGADLIPMMTGYRDAVKDAADYQKQFGIALSDTDTKKIDDIGDSMGRLTGTLQGVGTQLAVTFSPEIQTTIDGIRILLQKMAEAAVSLHDALATTDTQDALEGIASAASDTVMSLSQAAIGFQGLADGNITAALNGHAAAIQQATQDLQDGKISAAEYRDVFIQTMQKVISVYQTVEQIDGTDMSGAIGAANNFAKALGKPLDKLLSILAVQNQINATATAGGPGTGGNLRPDTGAGIGTGASGPSAGYSPAAVITLPGSSGGGKKGGGGGSSLADQLKTLRESLQTEAEAADAAYQARLKALEEFRQKGLLKEQEYNDLELRAKQEHQDALSAIDNGRYGTGLEQAGSFFADMASAMQGGNERMLKIAQQFGAAEALINAYRAASQTLADPKVPFLAKLGAAASALGAGMRMVSAIKGAGSSGGGGGSGGTVPSGGGAATSASQGPVQVNIAGFSPGQAIDGDALVSALKQIQGDRGIQIIGAA